MVLLSIFFLHSNFTHINSFPLQRHETFVYQVKEKSRIRDSLNRYLFHFLKEKRALFKNLYQKRLLEMGYDGWYSQIEWRFGLNSIKIYTFSKYSPEGNRGIKVHAVFRLQI